MKSTPPRAFSISYKYLIGMLKTDMLKICMKKFNTKNDF